MPWGSSMPARRWATPTPPVFRQDAKRLAKAQRRLAKAQRRLAKAQRRLAKQQRGAKNRAQARKTVARIHARIADRRPDFLHQRAPRSRREHQPICIERRAMPALGKQPPLANALPDGGWGEVVRLLPYSSPTRRRGMGGRSSPLIGGNRVPSAVRRAGRATTRSGWPSVSGRVRTPGVACITTVIPTRRRTFGPPDWRLQPVERRSDPRGGRVAEPAWARLRKAGIPRLEPGGAVNSASRHRQSRRRRCGEHCARTKGTPGDRCCGCWSARWGHPCAGR
jgi:hypothetical protein